ncbi:hypothetical protein J5N97_007642 [Dioscorea zingiberensis]|uniref:CAAX prenyl protease 2/Lysostaphin resistance protein A-like domain-containing protein n=1 Tax=Dioscorea zingiberensis TaxID=325984 RepID=A0A9D5DC82_9LILI|nr:hypothetical protein J5N97_007642 [Dioscorea zingiberensis]
MAGPSRCLPRPPLAAPSPLPLVSRLRAPKAASFTSPSLRGIQLRPSPEAANKRWRLGRVLCFMNEEEERKKSLDNGGFEIMGVNPARELENDRLEEKDKHWISRIRKVVDRTFKLDGEPWIVPWTGETIVQVMLLWILSFWFVGSWIVPFLTHATGFNKSTLTLRGQALYSLLTDLAEGLAGIAILHRCLARFYPLPPGWFIFKLKGSWHLDVGLGCFLFPLVNFLSRVNLNLVPSIPTPPMGVSSVEQSILARDPVAMALYAVVVSVCAPVWEEIVFRGFLLPSLTRYMSLWSSILVSAVAFALVHFNSQRLLPLVCLGVVMGVVFARSRNLLASMLLHSLWNGFVFLDLMK